MTFLSENTLLRDSQLLSKCEIKYVQLVRDNPYRMSHTISLCFETIGEDTASSDALYFILLLFGCAV